MYIVGLRRRIALEESRQLNFGPFRLLVPTGRLWRDGHAIDLRAQAAAVLRYLVEHAGRVVPREELVRHTWPGTHISKATLRGCIWEIRQALTDEAAAPRYIETVGHLGYRFLVQPNGAPATADAGGAFHVGPSTTSFVGRGAELAYLQGCLARAEHGARQVVFVIGEAGIGKTTLVQALLDRLPVDGPFSAGRGQCTEQSGPGEAYLPLLGALGRLGRGPRGDQWVAALRKVAPTWLAQLPMLMKPDDLEAVRRQTHGADRHRMLRELVDALLLVSAHATVVLVLEDLQWSDVSTVEWLAYLARRPERLRLLVIGTYRPGELIARDHPLRQAVPELVAHELAHKLPLELLTTNDVQAYVTGRLGVGPVATELGTLIHRRTNGNALFMVHSLEYLLQQGFLVREADDWVLRGGARSVEEVPDSLRSLLIKQLDALEPDVQDCLVVASVAGVQFTAAEVAAGLQRDDEQVESILDSSVALAQFVAPQDLESWPDGTVTPRYAFRHAVLQSVVYRQLGHARRRRLHQRLGERLEKGHGARAQEIATRLGVHFERAGDAERAARYLHQAGDNAADRSAAREALTLFSKALDLLATLADSPDRLQRAITLQLALGGLHIATKGRMSEDAAAAYSRVLALSQAAGDPQQRVSALRGLSMNCVAKADLLAASQMSRELLEMGQRRGDPAILAEGNLCMGVVELFRGDFVTARTYLEQSIRFDEASQAPSFREGMVPGVTPRPFLAQALWALGFPDQARHWTAESVILARQREHTLSVAYAELYSGLVAQCYRDVEATRVHADAALALYVTEGLELRVAQGRMLKGWALAMQGETAEGVTHLQHGLEVDQRLGPRVLRPCFLSMLAEAHARAGKPDAGLAVLDEALSIVLATEARWCEADLHRLKGALLLQLPVPDVSMSEACLHRALDVARGQQARMLELRAAADLARVWQRQGKREEARTLLSSVYTWFSEGLDTADLRDAQALIAAMPQGDKRHSRRRS